MDASLIDPSQLATLRADYGAEIVGELAADFVRIGGETARRLHQAAAVRDVRLWEDVAHELKGGARTMGLDRLAGLCGEIEAACAAGRIDEAARCTGELDECFAASVAALERLAAAG